MVESSKNKLIKQISFLNTKKGRNETGQFIIEGEKFVDEIPLDWEVERFLISETASLNSDKYKNRAETIVIKDNVFKTLSDTVTPQGVLAVCSKKKYDIGDMYNKTNPFIVVCERISDPGNLGTLIRTADAAGCDGIVLSENSVDVYNSKTVRATAGSIFHIPIYEDADIFNILPKLKNIGVKIVAAHLRGEILPYEVDFLTGCAILIGNESVGLSDEITEIADNVVKIPMRGLSESLNASVASGILIYEVVRQRINYFK